MTPPLDSRGRCSVCGRVEGHKPWCARVEKVLAEIEDERLGRGAYHWTHRFEVA